MSQEQHIEQLEHKIKQLQYNHQKELQRLAHSDTGESYSNKEQEWEVER